MFLYIDAVLSLGALFLFLQFSAAPVGRVFLHHAFCIASLQAILVR